MRLAFAGVLLAQHASAFLEGGVAHATGATFPSLAYGVRYRGWPRITLESSARVANDVQILGAIQIRTNRLRAALRVR